MGALATALRRAALYRLAAEAFAYPEPARLAALGERAGGLVVGRRGDAAVGRAVTALRGALETASAGDLAEEYVRLFDREVRVPLYETAYGDGRRLAGKPAELADIAGFYAAFGAAPSAAHPDLEDHVGAELEFMSLLALKEAVALSEGLGEPLEVTRAATRRFLADHLGRWAGALARRLAAATSLPFYVAAAQLVESLVSADARGLGVEPAAVTDVAPPGPLAAERFTCPFAVQSDGAEPDPLAAGEGPGCPDPS